uniref:Peptidase M1 leukotriene A4 hydrolase/aminopeptidase C-terminal domain-containing protein n=1 Tax=Pygocentrus nattereri TaxID=42514 RepID=A0AAR2JSW3_PYGNA
FRRRRRNPCSFSSFSKCLTRHLNLILRVDFDSRTIRGKVALTVEVLEDKFSVLTLDTKDLKIFKVSANGQAAKFELGAQQGYKGSPLEITLPFELSRGQNVIVEVEYETSPSASALQWLSPAQTAGKKHPYLFSQCQATHCRTMLPCQDMPSVKHTYYAKVPSLNPSSRSRMFSEIVCYVLCREIGPRSRVWSEKEYVDQAAFEFSETETMLKTAESLSGPYVWGQYDLLVLPPSFPYGGMENPCLTFATPTLLAGDRSLSNVIAHEISHSWTGNLVTNKTWEHFWLNEGHTVYLERMIGRALEGEQFRQFKARGGWKELQEAVHQFGENNVLTNLVPSLKDVDPDDCFSCVPYEKGFALLYYLEELLGGPEVFMGFVKSYTQLFAYRSVTTKEWKDYLFTYFKDKLDILNKVDWNGWMYTPGMPPAFKSYFCLINRLLSIDKGDFVFAPLSDSPSLSIQDPLPQSHVKRMQEVYNFNSVKNSEIRCRWLRLCVKAKWEEAVPLALKMATEQGRLKFTRPLFRDVYNFDKFRDVAVKLFKEHRDAMHPVTATLVSKDLKVDQRTGF